MRTPADLHRPYGAESLLFTAFPTLKRGANHHCASGALVIGTSLADNQNRVVDNQNQSGRQPEPEWSTTRTRVVDNQNQSGQQPEFMQFL
jgi:hypothetical protein